MASVTNIRYVYPFTTQCLGYWVWPIAVIKDDIQYKSSCPHIWHRRRWSAMYGREAVAHWPQSPGCTQPSSWLPPLLDPTSPASADRKIYQFALHIFFTTQILIDFQWTNANWKAKTFLTRAIRGSTRRALWDDRLTRRAWVMTLVSQGGPDLTTNRTWWITLLYPQHCTYAHIIVDPATSCTEELQSNSKAGILPGMDAPPRAVGRGGFPAPPRPVKMIKTAGQNKYPNLNFLQKRKEVMEQYYNTEQCPIQPVNRICKRK